MRLYYRYKERICTKKEKGVSVVKRRGIKEQLRKEYIRPSKLPQINRL